MLSKAAPPTLLTVSHGSQHMKLLGSPWWDSLHQEGGFTRNATEHRAPLTRQVALAPHEDQLQLQPMDMPLREP